MGTFHSHRRAWLAGAASLILITGALAYRRCTAKAPAYVEVAVRELKQTIVSSGQVMPPAEVRLESLLTTKVRAIHKREGDVVTAGEVILELDDSDLVAAIATAEAAVAQARAGKLGVRTSTLSQASEGLSQIRANLREARSDLERQRAMFAGDVVTASVLEKAQRAVSIFESQEKAALAQVRASSQGGATQLSASAALAVAEAQLAAVKVSLERATIAAPMDGIISERFVEIGEVVRPGSALLVLTAQGRTRIVLEPDERNLALLRLGQRAVVSAEAYPAETFDATLAYIAPAVNGARGTIEVRLNVANPPAYLRPNMTVSVELQVATHSQALALPKTAIAELGSARAWVGVLGPRGKVARREVALGLIGDDLVEIVSGLNAGERVVLDPRAAGN
ncbi:MAG: efflux RND transporter periplasmic adaptor subunit [Myxococcales bacterium]|nr:efflux RND transporter periplasmic adaptor subunit [Myxococcales bacterium]